ncbi:MAG: hypothetical protein LBB93_00805 [Elusimicrobiota bacterium]|jgi:hypothetical protein|nr:hypothetical protein [Elusimicrobiota bacterium]
MRKVRNFNINLRTKEILRSIKRLNAETEIDAAVEIEVQRACRYYLSFISPSVIYDVLKKDLSDFAYEKDAPAKWIARSVFFVSIGDQLQKEGEENPSLFSRCGENLLSTIAVDALDQSKSFVCRLIAKEAELEDCSITRAIEIPAEFYPPIIEKIPIDKIEMAFENGVLFPKYSFCAMVYWMPNKKKSNK